MSALPETTMALPWELVDLIMHFYGAYHFSNTERPYVGDLRIIKNVAMDHGVRRALLHVQEHRALEAAYAQHEDVWPARWYNGALYEDAMHLM